MPWVISLLTFAVVSLAVFAGLMLLDRRHATARILRDRLAAVQKPGSEGGQEFALLRDEMMSDIPAFDTLLRRSRRVSALQKVLDQGEVKIRAGNFLVFSAVSAMLFGAILYFAGGSVLFAWAGLVLGFFIP